LRSPLAAQVSTMSLSTFEMKRRPKKIRLPLRRHPMTVAPFDCRPLRAASN
jgi:hypothetical protein